MLDAERCILCSRCVRFCDEITGTGELGIFHRGDHSEIGLFPGKDLENKYSANVVDICPVGALTDRDFRFQVRVWYLDTAKSVCPGCARGCNIDVHVNRRRPHHGEGRRVARLKPRFNADVNKWWICDEGRYGYKFVDDPDRLKLPARRDDQMLELTWNEALTEIVAAFGRYRPEDIAVVASPKMSNEDLFALKAVLGGRVGQLGFRVPPAVPGDEDDLLIRADKNPNTRGAELMAFDGDVAAILAAARAGRVKCLWVFHHDLFASAWPEADVRAALAAVPMVIWSGTNANRTSARAHLVLPSAAWVEREGTFTSFEGRVQRFRTAIEPCGEALADWDMLGRLGVALGAIAPIARAEQWFRELAAAVPAFAGLSYRSIGDAGQPALARPEAVTR
jgi:NADH-quinone oxidoreductase subunit G